MLNNVSQSGGATSGVQSDLQPSTPVTPSTDEDPNTLKSPSQANTPGQQWVAKRDRHMQLINSAVYDQQAVARAKAMEATRQEKLKRRSEKQKLKLKLFFERSKISISQDHTITSAPTNQELNIGGMRYLVSAGGNKLVMVPGEI